MKFHTLRKEVGTFVTPNKFLEKCFLGTVTVGERGQIVIPAEARKKLEIGTGDKLFVMSNPSSNGLMIFKMDAMREFISHLATGLSMAETYSQSDQEIGKEE